MLRSLRFRTWFLLLLTTVCAIAAFGTIYYSAAEKTARASLFDKAESDVRERAEELSAWLASRLETAGGISVSESLRTGTADSRNAYLESERKKRNGEFSNLAYIDGDGSLRMPGGRTESYANSPYFLRAMNGGQAIQPPFFEPEDGRNAEIALYLPVYDLSYRIEGVLRATLPWDSIFGRLAERNGMAVAGYLADESGTAVYHTRNASALDAQTRSAVFRLLSERLRSVDNGRGELLIAYPVEGSEWHYVAGFSVERLYRPLDALLGRTVTACLAATLLIAGLLHLSIEPPFRRIKAMLQATEAVTDGRFGVKPLEEQPRDEIGTLAASINAMAEKLRKRYKPFDAVRSQSEYGIIVTDPDYVIVSFNEGASRILGYREEEVTGVTPASFSDPSDLEEKAERLSAKLGRTIAPGVSYFTARLENRLSYSEERIYVHKNGTGVPVFLSVSKMVSDDGQTLGYIGLFHDIVRQRSIQAELSQAKQAAEEASRAKSMFLARMSHEIRTPLNGIVGLSKLLQRTKMTDIQQDYALKIVSSSEVLLGIVNDILDFSKIEAGKVELETVSFEPDELFRKLADTIGIFIGKKQIEVVFDIPRPMPGRLIGDPLRLEQVLLNLLNNAIKFTDEGHVHFQVQTFGVRNGEAMLEFAVEDTGIGIAENQLAHLFTPFTQADGSTSRKYGGTGLGLVISEELVKLMGGRLEVESRKGVGSRFSFALLFPVVPATWAEPEISVSRPTVLCIERPGLMQRALTDMLGSIGMEATCSGSWKEAIALLSGLPEGESFDYVFFNMEMADMYGEETWFALRKAVRSAKTIAMTTAFGQNEWLRMPPEERPDRTLIKPVNRRAVQHMLAHLAEETRHLESSGFRRKKGPLFAPRILLVEDHAINQQVAKELLAGKGYEIGIACDGYEALDMLEREDWDLVLMDLHMPGLDGVEATRAIRRARTGWELPVIAMTANVVQEDLQKCFQAGMNDVVTKPIEPEELFAAVERGLRAAGRLKWEEASRRVGGKQAILWHMLHTFRLENRSFGAQLERSLASGEVEGSLKMLHGLKGVAGNLSAVYLFDEAAALETLLRRQGLAGDEWRQPLKRLQDEIRELCDAIEFEENAKRVS
ncbi:response regulator [Cohnella algarum]|uniref:response regulator n=1 Tax=Cohnella algarum TaxID=2044859 RepID=UPI0019677DEC|nr:response regulator [Cohnella algarum]